MAAISQWQLHLFSSMLLITAFDFEDTNSHVPATTRDCSNKVSVFIPTNIFILCAYGGPIWPQKKYLLLMPSWALGIMLVNLFFCKLSAKPVSYGKMILFNRKENVSYIVFQKLQSTPILSTHGEN